jgi:hypothetical protein
MDTPKEHPKHGFQDPDHCQRCGARLRRGGGRLCQKPAEVHVVSGKRLRCRLHGARCTGAKTPEGLARIIAANLKHGRSSKAAKEARKQLRERLADIKTREGGRK